MAAALATGSIDVVSVDFDLMDSDDDIVKAYEEAITPRTRVPSRTLQSSSASSALASCRSAVSKPSVNQP